MSCNEQMIMAMIKTIRGQTTAPLAGAFILHNAQSSFQYVTISSTKERSDLGELDQTQIIKNNLQVAPKLLISASCN